MSEKFQFTNGNIDFYLKELAKAYRKFGGKNVPTEIILIGGASIILNYEFRGITGDMDAMINASSAMKDAINQVAEQYDLPSDWLNSDFMTTTSYSPKLREVSKHYKTFSNVIEFRTVTAEYLIAMKLMSGRVYKHDISDVAGILLEHSQKGKPISKDMIEKAFEKLYNDISKMPTKSVYMLDYIFNSDDLSKLIKYIREEEFVFSDNLVEFTQKYPKVLNESNADKVILSVLSSQENYKQGSYENMGDEFLAKRLCVPSKQKTMDSEKTFTISRSQIRANADKVKSDERSSVRRDKHHNRGNDIG